MAGKRRTCRASGRNAPESCAAHSFPARGTMRKRLQKRVWRFFFPKAPEIRAPIRRQRPTGFPFRLLKLPGSRKRAGRPIVCDRTGNCSGRLAKQLARGGARLPRPSGKTAARGACRNMALQILRAVVYLSLMTVCGTGLSPCRTNAKGTQNARENFLLHF